MSIAREKLAEMASHCACFNLRKAARAVTQLYDDALRDTGLRCTQLTLLALLEGHGPTRMGELAEASGTDRTTLTRNLAVLQELELVKLGTAGEDARARRVELTATGRRKLAAAWPRWEAVQRGLVSKLGPARFAQLRSDLDAATRAALPH